MGIGGSDGKHLSTMRETCIQSLGWEDPLEKEMGIPDHLTCLLRNLYAGQEATVRTNMEQQTGSK